MNINRGIGGVLWVLALTMTLALGACETVKATKRVDALDDTTKTYGQLLRWGEYGDAVKFVVLRKGQPKEVDLNALKDIRVSSYEITSVTMTPDQKGATVTAVMNFYDERSSVIHILEDVQVWWYSDEGQHWLLDSELPDFIGALKKNR